MLIVQTPAANKKPLARKFALVKEKIVLCVSRQGVEARGNKLSAIYFQLPAGE